MSDPRQPTDPTPARGEDLHAIAAEQRDAVWGDGDLAAPGAGMSALMGTVGAKGQVDAQLRGVTRRHVRENREVPFGTAVPGAGRYVLLWVVGTCAVAVAIIVALGWLTS